MRWPTLRGTPWWALLLCYVWAQAQGYAWYSTALFGPAYEAAAGPQVMPSPLAFAFLALVLQPVSIVATALALGMFPRGSSRGANALRAALLGALIGLVLVSPPLAAAVTFGGKPVAAFLVPMGEQVTRMAGIGLILGASWRVTRAPAGAPTPGEPAA